MSLRHVRTVSRAIERRVSQRTSVSPIGWKQNLLCRYFEKTRADSISASCGAPAPAPWRISAGSWYEHHDDTLHAAAKAARTSAAVSVAVFLRPRLMLPTKEMMRGLCCAATKRCHL